MLYRFEKQIKKEVGDVTTIGILGYGVEGRSTYKAFRQIFPTTKIIILDKNETQEYPNDVHTEISSGEHYLHPITECDIVMRSPGIKVDHTVYHGRVCSQSQLFTKLCRENIIGITGTKGKSTTTSLIYHLLSEKYNVALVGNIGIPAFESLYEEYDYYICEYSCHQLSDMSTSPAYALLLNLFPEHLDYYDSVEAYYDTKKNIYRHQQLGDTFLTITSLATNACIQVNLDEKINVLHHEMVGTAHDYSIDGVPYPYTPNLVGNHNNLNQLFAISVGLLLDVKADQLAMRLQSFQGLPHRLEVVYDDGKVRYVNDSISTIPQSALAAMQTFEDLKVAMIGGYDRGIDYTLLVDYLKTDYDHEVILFSQVGKRLQELGSFDMPVYPTFAQALSHVLDLDIKEGTILMSPGASSYDEFTSFIQRGNYFKEMINTYYEE